MTSFWVNMVSTRKLSCGISVWDVSWTCIMRYSLENESHWYIQNDGIIGPKSKLTWWEGGAYKLCFNLPPEGDQDVLLHLSGALISFLFLSNLFIDTKQNIIFVGLYLKMLCGAAAHFVSWLQVVAASVFTRWVAIVHTVHIQRLSDQLWGSGSGTG